MKPILLGGDRGKWRCWEVFHDPEVLQGNLHSRVQEDHRRGLLGEEDMVSTSEVSQTSRLLPLLV